MKTKTSQTTTKRLSLIGRADHIPRHNVVKLKKCNMYVPYFKMNLIGLKFESGGFNLLLSYFNLEVSNFNLDVTYFN